MRLLLFFDLPTETKNDRKIYAKFRKFLIKRGYIMLQFSVYCKIFNNRDAVVQHQIMLRKNTPEKGQIRIMIVTEKQYAKMEIIIGGRSNQEQISIIDPFINL